jgi:hypothetical protein
MKLTPEEKQAILKELEKPNAQRDAIVSIVEAEDVISSSVAALEMRVRVLETILIKNGILTAQELKDIYDGIRGDNILRRQMK